MRTLHSYLIRVYRRDADGLAGLVEDVENGRHAPFRSYPELIDVLSGRRPMRRPAVARPRTAGDPASSPGRGGR